MLIAITLGIMLLLTLISIILGGSYIGSSFTATVDESLIVNGSTTTLEVVTSDYSFAITELQGGLLILVVLITVAGLIGIRILGSGLSDASVRTITYVVFYGGLWTLLSLMSYSLIRSIEVFGTLIYIAMTLMYVIGVAQLLLGGSA